MDPVIMSQLSRVRQQEMLERTEADFGAGRITAVLTRGITFAGNVLVRAAQIVRAASVPQPMPEPDECDPSAVC